MGKEGTLILMICMLCTVCPIYDGLKELYINAKTINIFMEGGKG
jgi:hypothetical protein